MKILFRALAILTMLAPLAASAALVSCGIGSDPYSATNCGLCDLGQLIQNVINFLVGISIPIAVGLFAWAGILYFTSATEMGKIERAKSIFKSVLIGFIIVLSAWIIVQTLLNGLVNKQNFFTNGSWNSLQCAQDSQRPRSASVSEIFGGAVSTAPGGVSSGGTGGASAGGVPVQITTTGPDGKPQTVILNTTSQNLSALQQQYLDVQSKYGTQIDAACGGSSIPNCSEVTTALIVKESSGNPATGCNGSNSCGLMQLSSANGGVPCSPSDSSCIGSQITKGVQFLDRQYSNSSFGGNIPNALAAYNGGNSTADGTSPSGLRPALAPSADCPGLYAWQCTTNPGGLAETQSYVATICAMTGLNGASCQ